MKTSEWKYSKECMCCLGKIACDYQESVPTGETDAGQSDPYRKSGYFCCRLILSDFAGEQDSKKYFS